MKLSRHVLCLALSALALPASAEDAPLREPMRIVLVRSAEANCGPDCSEWISAQGDITAETPARLRVVLRQLKGRKVPILISSYGGSVQAAYAMGRDIRRAGLDIGVASTRFEAEPEKQAKKSPSPFVLGRPDSYRTICASACTFVLAGGVRRFVPPTAMLGVHQLTLITTRTKTKQLYRVIYRKPDHSEVRRTLIKQTSSTQTSRKEYPTGQINQPAARYFAEMGIDASFIELTSAVAANSLRFMLRPEISQTRIATHTASLDPLFPSMAAKSRPVEVRPIPNRPAPSKVRPPVQTTVIGRVALGEKDGHPIELEFATSRDNSALMVHGFIRILDGNQALPTRLLRIVFAFADGDEAVGYNEMAENPDGPMKVSLRREKLCSLDRAAPVSIAIGRKTGEALAGMPRSAGTAEVVLPLAALRASFCEERAASSRDG